MHYISRNSVTGEGASNKLSGPKTGCVVTVHGCETQGKLLLPALGLGYWTPLPGVVAREGEMD